MRTRIPAAQPPLAAGTEVGFETERPPRRKLTGLAVVGYIAALLAPAIALALGAYLKWGRDERFHGTGVMVVAAAMIALCVASTLAAK
jgi:hypothetical protein